MDDNDLRKIIIRSRADYNLNSNKAKKLLDNILVALRNFFETKNNKKGK